MVAKYIRLYTSAQHLESIRAGRQRETLPGGALGARRVPCGREVLDEFAELSARATQSVLPGSDVPLALLWLFLLAAQ